MSEEVTFGSWLRQRRSELGITQDEFSERLGFSLVMLRKLESGDRRPSGQIAHLLADYLRIPADEREAFITFARTTRATPPSTVSTATSSAAPWRRAYVHQTNLPALLTHLIGREREAEAVCEQIRHPKTRLLTLTGPPGIGKTRLGLKVASDLLGHFDDGVFFMDLSPVVDPDYVLTAVATTLGLKEAGETTLQSLLLEYARERRMLLLLDNFEQVLDAAPSVVTLLETCPWLKVLVTSREALHVRGERLFAVPPLALPNLSRLPPVHGMTHYPAVELFLERAMEAAPEFALSEGNAGDVAAVCVRLEGLPLAIELAAARTRQLSPRYIQLALDNRLKMLTGGGRDMPQRHRTLNAAIEWSYNLLKEAEQRLFCRLGVFAGGFSSLAVHAVSGDHSLAGSMLQSLVDKNLVKHERLAAEARQGVEEHSPRFSMLETIREFALERLTEGRAAEAEETQYLHANYFTDLAEQAEPELKGPDQVQWLALLDIEFENIRAALEWTSVFDPEMTVRLMLAIRRFWHIRGRYTEGTGWLDKALAGGDSLPAIVRAKALLVSGQLALSQGNASLGLSNLEASLDLARLAGDKLWISEVQDQLAYLLIQQGEHERARALLEESLVTQRNLGDKYALCWLNTALGEIARLNGDYSRARRYYEEGLSLARETGNKYNICMLVANLGSVALVEGEIVRATHLFDESLTLTQEVGYEAGTVGCLNGYVGIAVAQGQPDRAAKLSGAMERLFEGINAGLESADQRSYEANLAVARAQVGEEAWETARAEGRAMSLDEAVKYALEMKDL